jgi:hypothetical protein
LINVHNNFYRFKSYSKNAHSSLGTVIRLFLPESRILSSKYRGLIPKDKTAGAESLNTITPRVCLYGLVFRQRQTWASTFSTSRRKSLFLLLCSQYVILLLNKDNSAAKTHYTSKAPALYLQTSRLDKHLQDSLDQGWASYTAEGPNLGLQMFFRAGKRST